MFRIQQKYFYNFRKQKKIKPAKVPLDSMPEGESSEAPAPPEKLKLQRRKAQQEPKV